MGPCQPLQAGGANIGFVDSWVRPLFSLLLSRPKGWCTWGHRVFVPGQAGSPNTMSGSADLRQRIPPGLTDSSQPFWPEPGKHQVVAQKSSPDELPSSYCNPRPSCWSMAASQLVPGDPPAQLSLLPQAQPLAAAASCPLPEGSRGPPRALDGPRHPLSMLTTCTRL